MPLETTIVPIGDAKGLFDPRAIRRAIDNALDGTAKAIKADYGVTTQTWRTRVKFDIRTDGPDARIISTASDVYRFVAEGTRVRYATMTPGFQSKTSPGTIASRQGHGGVMFISKKHPRPGIQARNFHVTISKKWQREWPEQLGRMIAVEVFR